MRFPVFDRAGKPFFVLRQEEAEALYSAKMAVPRGKGKTRALTLTCSGRLAMGFLRGKRTMQSQASKTFFVEKVGEDRTRLYQHDHLRCNGYADNLKDVLVTA